MRRHKHTNERMFETLIALYLVQDESALQRSYLERCGLLQEAVLLSKTDYVEKIEIDSSPQFRLTSEGRSRVENLLRYACNTPQKNVSRKRR